MKENKVLFLVQAAMIAAIYVVLCMIFQPISYGEIQVRIAEALTILPIFTSAAVPGVFAGCLIANLLNGAIVLDVALGSLATLIGALGTRALRDKSRWLAPLPPIVANMVLVPIVLKYGYGLPLPMWLQSLSVGVGEVISCGILGLVLASVLEKYRYIIFPKP